MNKRASLELSTNFIVILIISIVVFGFGLYFLTQLSSVNNSSIDQVNKQAEIQIQSLLDSGEQIIVYPEQLDIKRNGVGTFGVGIRNTLRDEQSAKFKIGVQCSAFISKSGVYHENDCAAGSSDYSKWTFSSFAVKEVMRNENVNIAIPMQVSGSASPGTYIFNVYVCRMVNPNGGNPDDQCLAGDQLANNLKLFPDAGGFLKFRVIVS